MRPGKLDGSTGLGVVATDMPCQQATSSHRAESVQAMCTQRGEAPTQVLCCVQSCGIGDAGAIPAASTFSELASTSDTSRLVTSQDAIGKEVATHDGAGESRQQAASSDMPRPVAATKSATYGSEADRDLAVVVAAWPNLADSVRAAVMRIIQASSSTT